MALLLAVVALFSDGGQTGPNDDLLLLETRLPSGDATREVRALSDALRLAMADQHRCCDWTVDHAGWVVMLE